MRSRAARHQKFVVRASLRRRSDREYPLSRPRARAVGYLLQYCNVRGDGGARWACRALWHGALQGRLSAYSSLTRIP